jgi:anti-anti-sigma factor
MLRADPGIAVTGARLMSGHDGDGQEVTQMPEAGFLVEVADGLPVVTTPDEIDVANAAALRAALADAARHGNGNGTLVVDMSKTQFCDSSGLNVLICAHERARAGGGKLLLVVSAAAVLRLLALTGADLVIPRFPSLDEALGRAAVPRPSPTVADRSLSEYLLSTRPRTQESS